MGQIVKVNPKNPDPRSIEIAGKVIQHQGLVIFPTEGLYGLGANALDKKAVKKVFSAKQRPRSKPLLILIHELDQLNSLTTHVPEQAKNLIHHFWPGPLTIVFEANPALPKELLGDSHKIGIRMPGNPIALELIKAAQVPITGTSANISDTLPCSDIKNLSPDLARKTDLILDGGILAGGSGSTIIDVTCNPYQIIRQGAIPAFSIQDKRSSPFYNSQSLEQFTLQD